MASRFTYSRWDGAQRGFEVDAETVFDSIADDLLYHGDVNSALRRLMHQGLTDRDGRQLPGLRDLMNRLRAARQERLERGDLGSIYREIADELADIVDEERHAIEQAIADARASGDERRTSRALQDGQDRALHLDLLPDDLPARVKGLQSYDFTSPEARQRFEQLVERLRAQAVQSMVDSMAGAMSSMTPEDVARTKDMLAELNAMLDRRSRGEDPGFAEFMERFGDMFPENPESLDELLEAMAQRMAAMQSMLASMSPEQRSQLQELSDQLLDDVDLRWQVDQLGHQLRQMFPEMPWGQSYDMRGSDPLEMSEALQTMAELGELDQLENLLRTATAPGALAEADLDRVAELLGDDAAAAIERLSELTRMLEEAGLIGQREGRLDLTPRALRRIGSQALSDLFSSLRKDALGQHALTATGTGHERTFETKAYEYGDPFQLDLHRTLRHALHRQGPGTPLRLSPEDFEVERTEHLTRSSTVLMLDLSLSMPMRDNFLPAKKVAVALHALISMQFPRDYLGLVGFSEVAREIKAEQLPEVSWDFVYGTNMQHGFAMARRLLSRRTGTKQIIMITDGEPTAHLTASGEPFFSYPPVPETIEATLKEVVRCTRDGIRINTFMLDATNYLTAFIERITSINRGRAFFTTPENLGDYVLVDFIEHKRELARGRQRRAG